MHFLKVRSFALAAFIIGRGVAPLDAVLIDGNPVFRFPPDADAAMDEYAMVKARLDKLERTARPIDSAGGGAR